MQLTLWISLMRHAQSHFSIFFFGGGGGGGGGQLVSTVTFTP